MDTKPQILLVEDDPLFAHFVTDALQDGGFSCTIARNMAELQHLLEGPPPDLVVADLHIPGCDEQSLLTALSVVDSRPPVILMTGSPSVETALQSIQLHVFAYLVKPFDAGTLMATVRQADSHRRLRARLGASHERFAALSQDLDTLRHSLQTADAPALDQTMLDYVALLLGHNRQTLNEAIDVLRAVDARRQSPPLRVTRHPDVEVLKGAVSHAIEVLEQTRTAFKSRELADLRKKLEATMTLINQ